MLERAREREFGNTVSRENAVGTPKCVAECIFSGKVIKCL